MAVFFSKVRQKCLFFSEYFPNLKSSGICLINMRNRHNGQQNSDKLKSHKPLIYMKQMVENAALSSN